MKTITLLLTSCSVLFFGCMTMKVEPIKIEVTVKVQVEKDLSNFFDDIDSTPVKSDTATTPADASATKGDDK